MTISSTPANWSRSRCPRSPATPQEGHEHGKPTSIRDYFEQEDLAQQYNLHQEANKIDLAALTDQIVFSKEDPAPDDNKYRVELSADRLHGAGVPGSLVHHRHPCRRRPDHRRTAHSVGWLADLDASTPRATSPMPRCCAGA